MAAKGITSGSLFISTDSAASSVPADEIDLLLKDLNADADTEISFAEFVDIMALLSTNV